MNNPNDNIIDAIKEMVARFDQDSYCVKRLWNVINNEPIPLFGCINCDLCESFTKFLDFALYNEEG